jgi:preprotein translocase subunit SecG
MRPNNRFPPSMLKMHRTLLAVVVVVFLTFCLGLAALIWTGPGTRALSRTGSHLLAGTSAILVITYVMAYVILRVLERRRGDLQRGWGQPPEPAENGTGGHQAQPLD